MGEEEEGEMKSSNREEKRSWKVMKELIKVSERCLCLMSVLFLGFIMTQITFIVSLTPPQRGGSPHWHLQANVPADGHNHT